MPFLSHIHSFLLLGGFVAGTATASVDVVERTADPCAAIGGQKWVAPSAIRACFTSIKVDPVIKDNIVQVINKTLAFHTSVNYELRAPEPFTAYVHEDLLGDLARISKQSYPSDYDLHIDLSNTLKRLNDGHCVWINACYAPNKVLTLNYQCTALFVNYLPTPLTLLTDANGTQSVHIAPEAFEVASVEFSDEIEVWQNALPGHLKGQLASLSGAKVLLINGQDPFVAVNANALTTGGFQALGTRQNSFFSSYQRSLTKWAYLLGNFAQQSLPLSDSVTLTILRTGQILPEVVTLPYRSRIGNALGSATVPFTDTASWRANNCVAINGTNGVDLFATSSAPISSNILMKFKQQPDIAVEVERKHIVNVLIDTSPPSDIALPPTLTPSLPALNGSATVTQYYLLDDKKTGVMAIGSFADDINDLNTILIGMLTGLQSLTSLGATQLIVDVSNNGGGFVCAAQWLHRIIAGPKSTTVPQAGLQTKARNAPLAMLIVDQIVKNNIDPTAQLMYNPVNWSNADNVFFGPTDNWLQPPVLTTINGRADAFSQRLGQECPENQFPVPPPATALFDPKKVVIVSNGRCASSCSLFSVTMNKEEGSPTVFLGGKKDVQQQYCGTVGGQATDFSTIDTEIKSTGLKNHSLAPPDLLVNGAQGIAWRLGFGIDDPTQPEEWQPRPVTLNLPITADIVNNPVAIWETVVKNVLS